MRCGAAFKELRNGAHAVDARRAVIHGVNDRGVFVGTTADAFFERAEQVIVECGLAYAHGNKVVFEEPKDGGGRLVTLAVDGSAANRSPPRSWPRS